MFQLSFALYFFTLNNALLLAACNNSKRRGCKRATFQVKKIAVECMVEDSQPKQCFVCAKFAQNKGKTLWSLFVFTQLFRNKGRTTFRSAYLCFYIICTCAYLKKWKRYTPETYKRSKDIGHFLMQNRFENVHTVREKEATWSGRLPCAFFSVPVHVLFSHSPS